MSHPFNSLRNDKVQKSRVADITSACNGGGMATGGAAHADEVEDKSLVRKMVKKVALRASGGAVKARSDRPARAWGGKVGGGKKKSGKGHTVNVIVAPHPPGAPTPPMVPGVAAAPPPMPPKPPMMPPGPGSSPGGPPPGLGVPPGGPPLPPNMPPGMHYAGGRTRAKGGKVEAGKTPSKLAFTTKGKRGDASKGNYEDADTAGIGKGRTLVQHDDGKQDTQNIGRGPVITKATGGPISSNYKFKSGMAPHAKGGAGGGLARLEEANHPGKYRV